MAIGVAVAAHLANAASCLAARGAKPDPKIDGSLVGHGGPVKAIAVSRDGTRVLTGSFDYAMMAWDVSGDEPRNLHRFDAHEGAVNSVAFTSAGRAGRHAIAAGDDGAVWLWDLASGKRVHKFEGHTAKINHVAVSDDGHYAVSASWDGTARVWDLRQLTPAAVLKGHRGQVNAVVLSQDATRVFTAGSDGEIRSWDRASGKPLAPLLRNGWGVNVLLRVPQSDLIMWGSVNGAVAIIDAATAKTVATLPAHTRPVLALAALEKPGLIATAGGDGIIRVMRSGDWALIEEYQNPVGPVWALSFAMDGKSLYFGGLDDFVTRWQISPRKAFEPVAGQFPRRFQTSNRKDLGARQFARKCSVCHTLKPDGGNRAGPTLYGIFGRKAGTLPGYPYSPALLNADIVWDETTIAKLFALGPEHYTPGSKMPLQKIADKAERDALIAYLKTVTGPVAGAPAGQGNSSEETPR